MQPLTYGTAGLLFPAISLLMLAYTNRFLGLASLARQLMSEYRSKEDDALKPQIANLRHRISLMRHAQGIGSASVLFCTLTLFALFLGHDNYANGFFAAALTAMVASIGVSLRETYLSTRALDIELDRFARG